MIQINGFGRGDNHAPHMRTFHFQFLVAYPNDFHHSQVIRQYFTPENQSLIRIFGGFSGLSLSFIPFIIPSFAPVLPQVVSSYARNFGVKNERLDDI